MLEPYGELSKCEMLSAQLQEAMRIPAAVLVEFAKFDPKRDLNSVRIRQRRANIGSRPWFANHFPQAVRQHDGFRIDAFDAERRSFAARTDADEEFLRGYDLNRRSVFVGGIPVSTQKEELMELFASVGEVLDAKVVQKSNYWGQSYFSSCRSSRASTNDTQARTLARSALSSSPGLTPRIVPSRCW
jgi:hypothetical protein